VYRTGTLALGEQIDEVVVVSLSRARQGMLYISVGTLFKPRSASSQADHGYCMRRLLDCISKSHRLDAARIRNMATAPEHTANLHRDPVTGEMISKTCVFLAGVDRDIVMGRQGAQET
jgi:hypothetical protein